ncbi:MAG TPA: ABC transporter permease [Thermoanaerobaculia bacterium]|nr:ABC transporter permease [Thermoanaerobaculia bacterium]
MAELVRNVRFAVRLLLKSPFLTAVTVTSLALGIGATTAVFSLVDVLLLRPLPAVDAPAELVAVLGVETKSPERLHSLSWGDYLDYAGRTDVVSGLAAVAGCELSLTHGGPAERISGLAVSPNYFTVLGVRPDRGRLFSPGEDKAPVAVISHGLWQRRFGASPDVIGSTITVNGTSLSVIGIAPEGFWGTDLGARAEIWIPLGMYSGVAKGVFVPFTGQQDRKQRWLKTVGRLTAGMTVDRAQSTLNVMAGNLAKAYPESNAGSGVRVMPLNEIALGQGMRPLVLGFAARLMAVIALVLAVVTINVAGLLLARGLSRRREIAVRLSLGAGRGHLIRQLFVEGVVLGLFGTVAGICLAMAGLPLLERLNLPGGLAMRDVALSGRALGFTILVSLICCVVFSLLPAVRIVRSSLVPALPAKLTGGNRLRFGLRELLVGLQIALALLVMIASGLMLRTVANLRAIAPGFDPAHVLVFSIDLAPAGYEGTRVATFYRDLLERLRREPGVRAASMASALPIMGGNLVVDLTVSPEDGPLAGAGEPSQPSVRHALIGSQYFETVGMKLVKGRDFGPEDDSATGTVVLNESAARLLWPGQNPLGRRLHLVQSEQPFSVIGVVADAKYATLKEGAVPVLYLTHSQADKSFIGSLLASEMTLLVRTSGEPRQVLDSVRETVRRIDPLLPVFQVSTLEELLASAIGTERQAAVLYGSLALVALVLAMLGLYGIVSNAVAERTREIGIRVACGATPGEVKRLLMSRSVFLVLAGVAAGLVAAVPSIRIVESQLYGVETDDPVTWLGIPLILVCAAMLVSAVPARRAARIDPVAALRSEG